MSEGSSGPGPARPADAGDDKPRRTFWDRAPAGQAEPAYQPPADGASPYAQTYVHPPEAVSPNAPTYVQPRQAPPPQQQQQQTRIDPSYPPPQQTRMDTGYPPAQQQTRDDLGAVYTPAHVTPRDAPYTPAHAQPRQPPPAETGASFGPTYIPPRDGEAANPASDVVRYGPGVPVSQAGVTAEQVWRTGRLPEPGRRPARMRRLAGAALTVILLAAAGVVLFLRFHHSPFSTTGVAITQQTKTTCGVNLTGRIDTNGSAGTVSYQWVFRPQVQAPQPLTQSVTAGQHAAFVTVAVEGDGHGTASQTVTLQVLGPDPGTATIHVNVSC